MAARKRAVGNGRRLLAAQSGVAWVPLLLVFVVLGALIYLTGPREAPERKGPSIQALAEARQDARATESAHARVIPQTDLPPEGTRSLFDHLLAENGGLPYPFEDLVALIESYDTDARDPVQVLIPDGRSLLKGQADFTAPRLLYAADFQARNTDAALGVAPRGQLFLGFVEGAAEIEVISYNERAGRFEFQLVKDYRADGIPRIVYAQRAVCLTCHQGGAPIFPERPWSETNAQPEIAQRIAAARGGEPYHGVPVSLPLAAPERFDELTDVANFIPVTQRAWLDGCRSGGCRRQMLLTALEFLWNPGGFSEQSARATELRASQALGWPADGIAVPESDLPNRDPLAAERGWRGIWQRLFPPDPRGPGAVSNDDLEAFEKLPPLPVREDPLTPRGAARVLQSSDLDGAFGLVQFFTDADRRTLEAAAGYDWQRLEAAVDGLDGEVFAEHPFSRVRLMRELLAALQQPSPAYCCDDTSVLSPPVALGVPPLDLPAASPLQPYKRFCFACHRGNPAARLNFMAGDSEEQVLSRIEDTPTIRDVLDWERYLGTDKAGTLMPPADSVQRAEMEAALQRGEVSLERMRDVVPSMFDF